MHIGNFKCYSLTIILFGLIDLVWSNEPTPPPPSSGKPSLTDKCISGDVFEYSFLETPVGIWVSSEEKCDTDGNSLANVKCENTFINDEFVAQFSRESFFEESCDATLEEFLDKVQDNVTSRNLDQIIYLILQRTTNQTNFTENETSKVLDIFESADSFARKDIYTINFNTTLSNMVETLTRISESFDIVAPGDAFESRKRIAKLLPSLCILSSIPEATVNLTNGFLALQISEHQSSDKNNITFIPANTLESPAISATIPGSLIQNPIGQPNNTTSLQTSFIYYNSDVLFPSVLSVKNVLSINIGRNETANARLKEPITITYHNIEKQEKRPIKGKFRSLNETVFCCVFWNFATSNWSYNDAHGANNESCTPVLFDDDGALRCQWHHLTNFALLVTYRTIPGSFVLNVITAVGGCLSILGLFLTIACLVWIKKLRKHRPGKILLHLCCNLCIVYIVFLASSSSDMPQTVGCIIATFLLHFFLLVSWSWMGIYAYEMYQQVVKVFHFYHTKFMVKASVVAYGSSALITVLIFAISMSYKRNTNENLLFAEEQFATQALTICWLTGYPLYFGFLLPVGIILLGNIFTFVMVIIELKGKSSKQAYPGRLKQSPKELLLTAITTSALMGFSWIFAFLMLFSMDQFFFTLMSWLFAITASFQGFVIFLLTVVRRRHSKKKLTNSRADSYLHASGSSLGSSTQKVNTIKSTFSLFGSRSKSNGNCSQPER